jgi:hypothetical protein
MPSSNYAVSVAFKGNNPVHTLIYQWLAKQPDTSSELIRDATIAIYGYRAIEQSDLPPEEKARALLISNAELTKFLQLNNSIAALSRGYHTPPPEPPIATDQPVSPPSLEDEDEDIDMDIDI